MPVLHLWLSTPGVEVPWPVDSRTSFNGSRRHGLFQYPYHALTYFSRPDSPQSRQQDSQNDGSPLAQLESLVLSEERGDSALVQLFTNAGADGNPTPRGITSAQTTARSVSETKYSLPAPMQIRWVQSLHGGVVGGFKKIAEHIIAASADCS